MSKLDMLVNYVRDEECRIAFVEDGKLEEFYSERASADLHVGNIYRGRVTNIEPSFQAAFIDFGLGRSGFLHVTDLHPRYFPGDKHEDVERVGHKTPRRDRPPIQKCLRHGQEILVQVLKEGIGTKGPTVTSYLSIPGRFLVMMPQMERHGVSRKIEDPEKRKQIHSILDDLDPPDGFGFIVRTAGLDRPKTELRRDLAYLLRLWKDLENRMQTGRGPAELYVESDLLTRTLRDSAISDVSRIIIDDRDAALRAKQFLRLATPRSTTRVYAYNNPVPLFDAFDMERQIRTINDRIVPLESGGSLVFDSTEAIVAVDVNSGKFRDHSDAETTAYKTNLEAVDEIARQLRLRDLGGIIVLDLIDMYQLKHRREVEKRFKEALKKDRARTKDMRISELGLLELTRQRMRPSLKKSIFRECPTCKGAGLLMSIESIVLDVMRKLGVAMHSSRVARVELSASADVLTALLNRRRDALAAMERSSGKKLKFSLDVAAGPDAVEIVCYNEDDKTVDLSQMPKATASELTDIDEVTVDDIKELDDPAEDGILDEESQVETGQPAPLSEGEAEPSDGTTRKKRRRRRRRRRGGGQSEAVSPAGDADTTAQPARPEDEEPGTSDNGQATEEGAAAGEEKVDAPKRRRRRRGGRRRRRGGASKDESAPTSAGYVGTDAPQTEPSA